MKKNVKLSLLLLSVALATLSIPIYPPVLS